MDEHWMTGLNEQTPLDKLEAAWQKSWQEWHCLHRDEPWNKENARLDWVRRRLNWIQALRQRQHSEQKLAMARQGLVTSEFILGSTDDPLSDMRF